MADEHNVDNHPDNNISHLPKESPPDGTPSSYDLGVAKIKNRTRAGGGIRAAQAEESLSVSDAVRGNK